MSIHPHFYNKDEETHITTGDVPHWSQRQKIYAVTFRLKDALPQHVVQAYLKECETTIKSDSTDALQKRKIMLHKKMLEYMDAGHGECILKKRETREIIEKEFEYISHDMALVHAYVIMPNHVHAIIETLNDTTIQNVMYAIKRNTAININKATGRSGISVWQREYFDRLIRSYAHYEHAMNYITANPLHCQEGEFTLWKRPYGGQDYSCAYGGQDSSCTYATSSPKNNQHT